MPKDIVEQTFTMMPMKTMAQGASTTCVAALDPKLEGTSPHSGMSTSANGPLGSSGAYLADCQLSETFEYARSESLAEKLWSLSDKLIADMH